MSMRRLVAEWGGAAGLCMVTLAAAGWLGLAPARPVAGEADLLAAVFAPWWPGQRVFLAASGGGAVIGFGAAPFVVIVAPDAPDGQAALHEAGAWLVLDARFVGLCGQKRGADLSS